MAPRGFTGAGLLCLALGLGCIDTSAIPAPTVPESLEWRKVVAEPSRPAALSGFAMATLGDKVVLYGGFPSSGPIDEGSDTWEWNGRAWTKLDPPARPPALAGHAMATLGNKVVLFGGQRLGAKGGTGPGPMGEPGTPGDETHSDETWEWDGTTWTQLNPPSSPSARSGHAMATLGNEVVLFGGQGETGELLNDTWTWDGTTWTRLDPASPPPPRTGHAMAALGDKVVLFGGVAGFGSGGPIYLNDSWKWDGTTWTQLMPPSSPSARSGHAMATLGNTVILFGGGGFAVGAGAPSGSAGNGGGAAGGTDGAAGSAGGGSAGQGATSPATDTSDTWQWDGTSWTSLGQQQPGPTGGSGYAMATLNGKIVLFGGDAATALQDTELFLPAADTWEWDGEVWLPRLVSPTGDSPYGNTMVALDGKALLFMGDFDRPTAWEWDGIGWTALGGPAVPPHPLWGGVMAVRGDNIVLFGGFEPYVTTDTWEWDGTSWSVRPTPTSPPGRTGHAMASLGDKLFLFGGTADLPTPDPSGGKAGSGAGAASGGAAGSGAGGASGGAAGSGAGGASGGAGTSAAASPAEGVTWEWDGATWTKLSPPVSPPARSGHAMVTVGNKIVLFGGMGVAGPLNDTWEWDGSSWTPLASPSSPPARVATALATWNDTVVLFGGSDGDATTPTDFHDTWALKEGIWTQLTPITYPPGRSGHLMARVNGEIVLIGGGSDKDTWLLGPGR